MSNDSQPEKEQFIADHLAGMTSNELAVKYGINQQAVAARLRYARERGDLDRAREDMLRAMSSRNSDEDSAIEDVSDAGDAGDAGRESETFETAIIQTDKTAAEIKACFGTLQDKHIIGRLRMVARTRVLLHERKLGKKDSGFRIAQELWVRKERLRMLGLTMNDYYRMRGMNV